MTLRTALLGLLAVFAAGTLSAQTVANYHTTLLDHANPLPGDGIRYSSLTGYVAPDGREYALLAGVDGTYIYDVTEMPMRQVTFIPGLYSNWREMKTYRTWAYIVSEGILPEGNRIIASGLQIVDLSKLPETAELVRTDTTLFRTAHTITQQGDYIYVHGTNTEAGANRGTIIYDVASDPLHPRRLGVWADHYVHDATVRNDTLYAAAVFDGMLDIVYLGADRMSPRLVTQIRYPDAGTHSSAVTKDGSYVMTTDEINMTPKTLKVWDIRDVENITKVADYTPAPGEIIHNVYVKGDLAFVSWYTAGTRILDISDPTRPVQLGYYDTYPGLGASFDGNWEVYPYLPSGKILSSDRQSGLYVFTFDGVKKGRISGQVLDSATGEPLPFARITLAEIRYTIVADSLGRYSFEGAIDTLNGNAVAVGHYSRAVTLMPTPDGAVRDVRLRSVFTSGASEESPTRRMRAEAIVGPNPMTGHGAVSVANLEPGAFVSIGLYDALGRRVSTIFDGVAGDHLLCPIVADVAAGLYYWRVMIDGAPAVDGSVVIVR